MRVLPVVAAVILVFLGVVAPRTASAQEVQGRLELTVRICVNFVASPRVVGTFEDTLCDIASSADSSQNMTIQLDGGEDGFTVTQRYAPLFWPDIMLTPGAYTLTITTPGQDGEVVTSTDVTIAAEETTALTYTLIYAAEVEAVPPPPPVDDVPEVPADPVATPTVTEEVVTDDPTPPVATDPGEVSTVPGDVSTVPEDAPSTGVVVSLPNTGSGAIAASSPLTGMAFGLASIVFVTVARVARRRRA